MEKRSKSPKEGQSKGISFLELPVQIIHDILSRLPLSAIMNCQLVCKAFFDFLKDPYFAKLYHARTPITILRDNSLQRNFYLLEQETCTAGVPRCRAITTLNNFSQIKFVNSCNGLICLYNDKPHEPAYYIWNPLRGELEILPKPNVLESTRIYSWFGFSPINNQYKVIRMICPSFGYCDVSKPMAEVHTIGTKSWRNIGEAEWPRDEGMFDPLLNGFLHWIVYGQGSPYKICAFDVHNERFQHILPPPEYVVENGRKITWMNVSAVGGCLCSCIRSIGASTEVWMMKDYGFNKSWTRKFIIDVDIYARRGVAFVYQPIRFLENGDVWLICDSSLLISYNPGSGTFEALDISGIIEPSFEAIAYFPSFVRLRDAMVGEGNQC